MDPAFVCTIAYVVLGHNGNIARIKLIRQQLDSPYLGSLKKLLPHVVHTTNVGFDDGTADHYRALNRAKMKYHIYMLYYRSIWAREFVDTHTVGRR